jgi:AAA+ ATPase superfamily predicted ATPase
VIKGRRRIGKSRLILEFSKEIKTFYFTGFPPETGTSAQTQRDYFVQQMQRVTGIKGVKADDWDDIFWQLSKVTQKGRLMLVLDEINWMGSFDHTFLGKLKTAWDLYLKNNPKLLLVLSGSMSSWIDENILSSTGFMGRTSLELTLEELPLSVCNLFWRRQAKSVTSFEKFKILSVTGGVPRYLEEIDPHLSAEQNLQNLAFQKGGLLVEEFDRIFSDLFSKRSKRYKQIVEQLVEGSKPLDAIAKGLKLAKSGTLSTYLDDLVETGYVARDYTWNIKQEKVSNLCTFRLKDNYLRFYLKYIQPHRTQIDKNRFKIPPAWSSIMGLQFENLILNNSHKIHALLNIEPRDVVYDNPYFQRATEVHLGCQIDYLIQTRFQTLYVCEVKFSKDPIGATVIDEVKQKCQSLSRPKNFSIRPVLIHVNGVTDAVLEREFFAKIIDFGQFLI